MSDQWAGGLSDIMVDKFGSHRGGGKPSENCSKNILKKPTALIISIVPIDISIYSLVVLG